MIEGFEDITEDLSIEELAMVPLFVESFAKKFGKDKAVTSKQIIERLAAKKNLHLTGARVRKIINYIRTGFLVPGLIASSNGYYVSRDVNEIKEYINSLGHREAAIGKVRKSMEDYLSQLLKQ